MDGPVSPEHAPARWSTRFGAWLIDVVLVGAVVALLGPLVQLNPLLTVAAPVELGQHGVILFVYWTAFEWTTGQSPGKLVLDIQVVDETGRTPSVIAAGIQSFGKAFILPVDLVIGLLAMPGEGRRLFNRLSGTCVVSVPRRENRQRGPSAVEG